MSIYTEANAVKVELTQDEGRAVLLRDGKPFFVKGAGGSKYLDTLARSGGNALRTWHISSTESILDEADRLDLAVCAGIWLEHERHGFDYDDEVAVEKQFQKIKAHIDKVKGHPALLMWGVGNELEMDYTNLAVWDAAEQVLDYIKKVDPNHPVMLVTAFIEPGVVASIMARCPSIDILGVNAYGNLPAVENAVQESAWNKPYMITEWGVSGFWEVGKTNWGAEIEPTSTQKAVTRLDRYRHIAESKQCLGGFAFLWEQKQERTATWFNLFFEDGSEEEGVETMQYLWTGSYPEVRAPQIGPLNLNGWTAESSAVLARGTWANISYDLLSGEIVVLDSKWVLVLESEDKKSGGDFENTPDNIDFVMERNSLTSIEFQAPETVGNYRLFLYLRGPGNKTATANYPFAVR